jgi:hypothetical protein
MDEHAKVIVYSHFRQGNPKLLIDFIKYIIVPYLCVEKPFFNQEYKDLMESIRNCGNGEFVPQVFCRITSRGTLWRNAPIIRQHHGTFWYWHRGKTWPVPERCRYCAKFRCNQIPF